MIQEKNLEKIPACLNNLGLTVPEVWEHAMRMPQGVRIVKTARRGTDAVKASVDVKTDPDLGLYSVDGYEITLLRVGDIRHTVAGGIDTAELEKTLEQINWGLVIPPLHTAIPEVTQTLGKLFALSAMEDKAAVKVAEELLLKYLANTPLEDGLKKIGRRKQYETDAFIEITGNAQDLDMTEAYHLLCGRGVAKLSLAEPASNQLCWMVLQEGKVTRLPDFDLEDGLKKLPFATALASERSVEINARLSAGEQLQGNFVLGGKRFAAFYQADPHRQEIAFFDFKGQRLNMDDLKQDATKVKQLPLRQKLHRRRGLRP